MEADKDFHDQDTADRYLKGCIVRLKGEPIYIDTVDRSLGKKDWLLKGRALNDADTERMFFLPNKDINYKPVDLGFCNYPSPGKNTVFTVLREAMRVWKMGLSQQTMKVTSPAGCKVPMNAEDTLTSEALYDTMMGRFPTYDEALLMLYTEECIVAFSRRFAIDGNGLIHYYLTHGEEVGTYTGRLVSLCPKYRYLNEIMMEDMNHGN